MAKILIIEDEAALAKNLAFALNEKHQVILALTGKEGLSKIKSEKPDFILLDVMLPDITGFEILKELKSDNKTEDIPVLVSTNLDDKETVAKIIDAGGRDYVVKSDWKIED